MMILDQLGFHSVRYQFQAVVLGLINHFNEHKLKATIQAKFQTSDFGVTSRRREGTSSITA